MYKKKLLVRLDYMLFRISPLSHWNPFNGNCEFNFLKRYYSQEWLFATSDIHKEDVFLSGYEYSFLQNSEIAGETFPWYKSNLFRNTIRTFFFFREMKRDGHKVEPISWFDLFLWQNSHFNAEEIKVSFGLMTDEEFDSLPSFAQLEG